MPKGFKEIRFAGRSTNTYKLDQNCYYCTLAALMNKSVEDAIRETEIMQQDTATPDEIIGLFKEAGISAEYKSFTDAKDVYSALITLKADESVGLAYSRENGSGHMVVASRDEGFVNNFVNPGVKCVDYQQDPPKIAAFPPEPKIARYFLFYQP